jgi:ankyrin repeat protein
MVELLIEKGANVNALSTEPRRSTPAVWAAILGYGKVLKTLIHHGADLSIILSGDETLLEATLKRGRLNTAKILLEAIGGPDYPKDSVALQIATTRSMAEMRPLISTISLMFPQIGTHHTPPEKWDWIKWVLDQGGELVRPRAMLNLLQFALHDREVGMAAELLRLGIDPNTAVFDGDTPLNVAVRRRNKDLLRLLLDAGADPAQPSQNVKRHMLTPLHQAIVQLHFDAEKDTSIVDILLATGKCRLMEGEDAPSTAFAYVLRRFQRWENELAKNLALRMLDSISDVNEDRSDDGCTLMHTAVLYRNTELVEALQQKGADINAKDNFGDTPFLMACRAEPELLDFLIARGADAFAVDNNGFSALHIAAAHGLVPVLKYLLGLDFADKDGLNIEATDKIGRTALIVAMATHHEETALCLLDQGAASTAHRTHDKKRTALHYAAHASMHRVVDRILAQPDSANDINVQDTQGWTPLAVACAAPAPTITANLLSHGAHINNTNPVTGNNALHIALQRPLQMGPGDKRYGDPALVLLQHSDIDIAARDVQHRTPLHLAAQYHNSPAAQLLLSKGASPDAVDAKGKTPLSMCSRPDIAQALLDYGADVNHTDPNGWTPVHHAVNRCWVKVYAVLVRNGADLDLKTSDDGLTARERLQRMGGWDVWVRRETDFMFDDVERERRREGEMKDGF